MNGELPMASATAPDPAQEAQAPHPGFANPSEAQVYLDAAGWKISQSTIYIHAKAGKLRPGPDGSYTLEAVEAYAKKNLRLKDGSRPKDKASRLQEEKLQAEVERTKEQAKREALKNRILEGTFITRAQYEQDLADRARLLRSDAINFFRTSIDSLIALVGGDPATAAQALAWCEERVEEWLDRYAREGEIRPAAVEPLANRSDGN
ncbi:MAG: hypothetical protein HY794_16660 [Desulfarculus sp.]|nr:hypothetical protein [Desulfarculus sp.]